MGYIFIYFDVNAEEGLQYSLFYLVYSINFVDLENNNNNNRKVI